jgi:thioredoxin-related protein
MKLQYAALSVVALWSIATLAQSAKLPRQQPDIPAVASPYMPVHRYDPSRDAVTDIEQAIGEAQKAGKRIIVEVGGDWCPWCHALNQFFQEHPDIVQVRDQNFVTVYVYYNSDKKNEQALSRYYDSTTLGIPHFFVLDRDGALIKSEDAVNLEAEDASYSPEKVREFLGKWSPSSKLR